MSICLAVDAMGGDHGIDVTMVAALQAVARHTDLHIVLVGDTRIITPRLRSEGDADGKITVVHAGESVAMNDSMVTALRRKKDSSMRRCLDLVANGDVGGCVSAGNTGALMALARLVLKTLPGIDRPAICGIFPTMHGRVYMLDLGANVDSTADQLHQFAVMGAQLVTAIHGKQQPAVALLNIGHEDIKGNDCVKRAHELLTLSNMHYVGFIEGDGIYMRNDVDVIVCDGFAGNVALKASEGLAKMLMQRIRGEFGRSVWNKCVSVLARPVLRSLKQSFDPRQYNGASLLGLRGIVVKSHGSADEIAFANAISEAYAQVIQDIPSVIGRHIDELADASKVIV